MSEWAPKRFWKEVSVAETDGGFGVNLDHRSVRTPAKKALIVPTRRIADRIAGEWDAQTDSVDPTSMPWTRSANAAIDKVSIQSQEVRSHLAGYADTDLLLYRAEGPDTLVARQRDRWDPVLDWVKERYGIRLRVTQGVMPVMQDETALSRLADLMAEMTAFKLTGFHDLVTLTGSYALGLAAAEGFQSVEDIWLLSRLDEEWQIEQWGEDEEASEHAALKKMSFLHAYDFFHSA